MEEWAKLERWTVGHAPAASFSDFGWGELVSSIGRRVRTQAIRPEIGSRVVAAAAQYLADWERLQTTNDDIDRAAGMVGDFSLALRLPDAIHLAIASRNGTLLLTTDRRQASVAAMLGIDAFNPLEGTQ